MAGQKIGEGYIELRAKMAKFESELKRAEVMTGKSVSKMQAKFKALAPTFRKIGIGMGIAGGAITAAVAGTFKIFTDYETKLVDMAKVTGETFESIEKSIKGIEPILGSSTELMEGYYQVISAGITDPVKALSTLTIAAQTAKAAHIAQSEVVKGITKMMEGYGGKIRDAAEAADLLFSIERLGQTAVAELIPIIGGLSKVSDDLNVDQIELAASLALITKTAGSTAEAGTQYQAILTGLMKPTEMMTEAMADMGFETAEAAIAELGFIGVLKKLEIVTGGSAQALGELFGRKEAMLGFSALGAKGFKTLNDTIIEVGKGVGGQKRAFEEWSKSGQAAIDEMKNTFVNFGIDIGRILAPKIKELIGKVTGIIDKMADWAKAHPGLTSAIVKFATVLGPLLIGLGGLLIVLPGLVALAPMVSAAFHIMLGPIGLITAAIAGAVAAFLYFYKTNKKFATFVNNIGAWMKALAKNIWNHLVWIKDNWGKIWKTMYLAQAQITKNAFDNLVTVFKWVGGFIKDWGIWLGKNFVNAWKNMFSLVSTGLKNFGTNIVAQLGWLGEKMNPKNWFKKIERPDWTPLFEGFEAVWEEMPVIAELALKKITTNVENFMEPLPELVKPILKTIKEGADEAGKAIEGISTATSSYNTTIDKLQKLTKEASGASKEQNEELVKLQERLKQLRGQDYIRALENMITRQQEQKDRTEEQVKALKELKQQLKKLRGQEYIVALQNMIKRQMEQKKRTEEQEKALEKLKKELKDLRGKEYIRSLENMIKRQIEQKERTEEQEKALKELQKQLKDVRGQEYIRAIQNMILRQIEQMQRTEEQEKALKELDERLKSLRGDEYIRALQNMILRQIEQKEATEKQEMALLSLAEQLKKLRGDEYIRAIQNQIQRQIEQKEATEAQEKALKDLEKRLKELRGEEYIRALQNMIQIQKDQIETTEEQEEALRKLAKAAKEAAEKIKSAFGVTTTVMGFLTDVIKGAKEGFVALEGAFLSLISKIPLIGGFVTALYELGKALGIIKIKTEEETIALLKMINVFTDAQWELYDTIQILESAFKDMGMALTGSIDDASRSIRDLAQSQEDLALSTREKLIKELDSYYDYRVLKEMDLTELLALSAETREKIETDSMEKSLEERIKHLESLVSAETATTEQIEELARLRAEAAEETAEREKDAKVGTLQAIEEAYARESEMIDRKIKLIEIEIILLMAAAEAEQGNLKEAEKLREKAIEALKDLQEEWEDVEDATEDATKATKEYGKEGKRSAKKVRDAFEDVTEEIKDIGEATEDAEDAAKAYGEEGKRSADEVRYAFDRTKRGIEELKDSTDEARYRIDDWGESGRRNAEKIREGFEDARIGIEDWSKEIDKLPREIKIGFDIEPFPKIEIPRITIPIQWGRIPFIPKFQLGTPFVPRTQLAIVHKGEAIIPASENRVGRGVVGGNTFNTRIRTGDIRSDIDMEKFIRKVADRITRNMERV